MGIVNLHVQCKNCFDTGITYGLFGVSVECPNCIRRVYHHSPIHLTRQNLFRFNQINTSCELDMVDIARLLCHATSEQPIPSQYFEEYSDITRRAVGGHIRRLKDEWRLPIVARRDEPNGYWIATTAEEFELHEQPYRRQAYSTLRTSWALRRANWSTFAGQNWLDFMKEVEEANAPQAVK